MKIFGIVLLVFAALNLFVAIAAASNGAADAAGQKMSAVVLLTIIGCLLFYFGKQKDKRKEEAPGKKKEDDARTHYLEEEKRRKEIEKQHEIEQQKKKIEEDKKRKEFEANSKKYKILNFYLDCSHWHEQEKEIQKNPLALPVEIVDVDMEDDITEKYHVYSLPKLILVDFNGKEIKRWKGVTETSEINKFLYSNGYAEAPKFDDKSDIESLLLDNEEDCVDYPKPMFVLGPDDMQKLMTEEFMDKSISIAADGGTKEQTQVKFEVLLGKREKTEAMLAIEKPIRDFFHKIYENAAVEAFNSSDKTLLRKLAVATRLMQVYIAVNDEDGELHSTKEQMTQLANRYGVSVNLIEGEEKEKVTAKYSK